MCCEENSNSQRSEVSTSYHVSTSSDSSKTNTNHSSSHQRENMFSDPGNFRTATMSSPGIHSCHLPVQETSNERTSSSQTLLIGRFRVNSVEEPTHKYLSEDIAHAKKLTTTESCATNETSSNNCEIDSESLLRSNVEEEKNVSHSTDDLLFNLKLNCIEPSPKIRKYRKSFFSLLKPILKLQCMLHRM